MVLGSPQLSLPSSLGTSGRILATDPEYTPLVFSVQAGSLPPGLFLSPAGQFYGSLQYDFIPSTGCADYFVNYVFTVVASDGSSFASGNFSILVSATANLRTVNYTTPSVGTWVAPYYSNYIDFVIVGGGGESK